MKRVETYRGSGEYVDALQDADLRSLSPCIAYARDAWHEAWLEGGCVDEGSCCVGIGIEVWYLPPRARNPRLRTVIAWNWTQRDFGAYATKDTPLRILAEEGVKGIYNCGRMD